MSLPELPYIDTGYLSRQLNQPSWRDHCFTEINPHADKHRIGVLLSHLTYNPRHDTSVCGVNREYFFGSNRRYLLTSLTQSSGFCVFYNGRFYYDAVSYSQYFTISTVLLNRNQRHYYLPNFRDLFKYSLDFFESQERNINTFRSEWSPYVGADNMVPSVNYTMFADLVARGDKPSQAAFKTPTGIVARQNGFTKFELYHNCLPQPGGIITGFFNR